jgi:hypothetical protein
VRNTILNANTWQRNTNPATAFTAPDHYNDFGYNIGGPFYIPGHFNTNKDKVFWYWGQEFTRNYFTDTSSMTVPTMKMRNGDFSELLDPNNIFYGHSVQLVDPKTGLPFPGNIIPAPGTSTNGSTASPNGLGLLKSYPARTIGSATEAFTILFGNTSRSMAAVERRRSTLTAPILLIHSITLGF